MAEYEQKQVEFYTAQDGATKPQSKTLPRRGKSDYLSDYHDMGGLAGGNSSSGASGGPALTAASGSGGGAGAVASFGQVSLFEEKNEFLWECDHPKPGILSSILDKVNNLFLGFYLLL